MIKLEDLLLTAYCDVAIMDNIYPVMTINYNLYYCQNKVYTEYKNIGR